MRWLRRKHAGEGFRLRDAELPAALLPPGNWSWRVRGVLMARRYRPVAAPLPRDADPSPTPSHQPGHPAQ